MYLGIDIASVDGNKPVDWVKAKAAGVQFAFFRGTYITWQDPTWHAEADLARAAGLTVGAYLFPVMGVNSPSAQAQVNAFAKYVQLDDTDLPPALDVEFSGGIAKTGRTRPELLTWIREAVAALKTVYETSPIIYTSSRVWDGDDADSLNAGAVAALELANCPLWLARYPYKTRIDAIVSDAVDKLTLPPVPKAWGDSTNVWIHQYQGDALKLSGFSATVDLNRFFDLKQGDSQERVKFVQRKLKLKEDGSFGPLTFYALRTFQKSNGLLADGIVGPKTFARLCWLV